MKRKDFALANFKVSLYELETVLSMSPLYSIEHDELLKTLSDINEAIKNIYSESKFDAAKLVEEFPRIQSAFANNHIEIYMVK